MERICEFIEIGFAEPMLTPETRADKIIDGTWNQEAHQSLRKPVAKVRDWRHDVDPTDVAVVEAIASRAMLEHGYEPHNARIPLSARLRVTRYKARGKLERRRRRRS